MKTKNNLKKKNQLRWLKIEFEILGLFKNI